MTRNQIKRSAFFLIFSLLFFKSSFASDLDTQLSQTSTPYVKYFKDRAMWAGTGFDGLTCSFQLYLGNQTPADEAVINYGAVSYDQSILSRIGISSGSREILDTYVSYATEINLGDPNNPLINCNGNYYGAAGPSDPIRYGLYRVVRISGRTIPGWWNTWDWIVDTGATACFIIDALEAYQKTSNVAYKNFAVLLGSYILKLKDSDGGIRYGPRGMYHVNGPDFYWNLKSTEQNERCLYAFEALYAATGDVQYNQAALSIKNWLKAMYNKPKHLFHSAATFNGATWVKSDIDGYIATDVTAFAPLELMLNDSYFGSDQLTRDAEVDAMFTAIETKTGFLGADNKPLFFRFSTSQSTDPVKGGYGSVEWSSQMALAYLRAGQIFSSRDMGRSQVYLSKYNSLISSIDGYFSSAVDDQNSKIASYASFYNDKSVAGNVTTGTGYFTFNCQGALASAYYCFAKAGYDPVKLGGGPGIPGVGLNLIEVPWYQNAAPYSSTGAASAQMVINFMRIGAGASVLTQNEIYQYAKSPNPYSGELNPDEIAKVLGHFDPYDTLVSNWSDSYNSLASGNPYKGYNFSVDAYDPVSDPQAFNKYMRDICHWMAYTVTKEDWWLNGELAARPNTPAVVPIYGNYNHWVVVKGFSASANPCPEPHTNPMYTPSFTVNGLWIKDPLISGIGQDTYKTAVECATYFIPLSSSDNYNAKFVQVAEPPPYISKAKIKIDLPSQDIGNLDFIGIKVNGSKDAALVQARTMLKGLSITPKRNPGFVKKVNWKDVLPGELLADKDCITAFETTNRGNPVLVKFADKNNSAGFYLVPFNKINKKRQSLTSAVIMLDASDGHFKEASWTKEPVNFLPVDRSKAINLVINSILRNFAIDIRKTYNIPIRIRNKQRAVIYRDYARLINYIRAASAELLWKPNSKLSLSPYQPYWKINGNGYIWLVTQEGKIIPEKNINRIINEIGNNRMYLLNKLK